MKIVGRSLAVGPMKVKAAMLKRAARLAGWVAAWVAAAQGLGVEERWRAAPQVTSASSSPQSDNQKEDSSFLLPSPALSKQGMCMCVEGEGCPAYLSSVFLHRALKD